MIRYLISTILLIILLALHSSIFNGDNLLLASLIYLGISFYLGKLIYVYFIGVNISDIKWTSDWSSTNLKNDKSGQVKNILWESRGFEMTAFVGGNQVTFYGVLTNIDHKDSNAIKIEDLRSALYKKLKQNVLRSTMSSDTGLSETITVKINGQESDIMLSTDEMSMKFYLSTLLGTNGIKLAARDGDSQKKELMTEDEIHDFGVEVVSGQLKKEGFRIHQVNPSIESLVSIVASKDEQKMAIAVKTDVYPEKGSLNSTEIALMHEKARTIDAIPFFASVGIANADGKSDQEMSVAVKGAGFHVAYEGIVQLATD